MHRIFSKSFLYRLQAYPIFIVPAKRFNICAGLRNGRTKGMLFDSGGIWGCRFASTTSVDVKGLSLKRRPMRRLIHVSTFNPDLLQAKDFVDISSNLTVQLGRRGPRFQYGTHTPEHGSFPQDTRGFFYYYQPPGLPDIAGEICFRITSNSNPASFHLGADLMTRHGMPWRIQVFRTANFPAYRHMWDLLLRDDLTTPSMLLECQRYLSSNKAGCRGRIYLFAIDQPFPFAFHHANSKIWVATGGKIVLLSIQRVSTKPGSNKPIFAGHATLSLELSRAPEHKGKVALLFRVLKLPGKIEYLLPNDQGHFQQPTEGSYLMVQHAGKAPEPYCRVVGDSMRHIIEHFDDEKPDSLRQLKSRAIISTLDRKRLQSADCVQLLYQNHLKLIPPNNVPIKLTFTHDHPRSPAFLYYHLPPGLPETAGEIRMRLTASSDPSSFDGGTDLMQQSWTWKLPLITIAGNPSYAGLSDLLLRDGLVTHTTLSACKQICDQHPRLSNFRRGRIFLHTISQPFFLDLPRTAFWLVLVSGNKAAHCFIQCFRGHFLKGRAMLRFEPQPGSPRRLAIRVLQIIEPIRYPNGSEYATTEGSLLRNPKNGTLVTVNVDGGKRHPNMALLWPENLPSSTSSNALN